MHYADCPLYSPLLLGVKMSKESPRLGLQPKTPTDGRFSLLNRNDDGAKSLDRPDAGDNRDISVWETSGTVTFN